MLTVVSIKKKKIMINIIVTDTYGFFAQLRSHQRADCADFHLIKPRYPFLPAMTMMSLGLIYRIEYIGHS